MLARAETQPEPFDPYAWLSSVRDGNPDDYPVFFSDAHRASDLPEMLKAALIAAQLLSERVKELETKLAALAALNGEPK